MWSFSSSRSGLFFDANYPVIRRMGFIPDSINNVIIGVGFTIVINCTIGINTDTIA